MLIRQVSSGDNSPTRPRRFTDGNERLAQAINQQPDAPTLRGRATNGVRSYSDSFLVATTKLFRSQYTEDPRFIKRVLANFESVILQSLNHKLVELVLYRLSNYLKYYKGTVIIPVIETEICPGIKLAFMGDIRNNNWDYDFLDKHLKDLKSFPEPLKDWCPPEIVESLEKLDKDFISQMSQSRSPDHRSAIQTNLLQRINKLMDTYKAKTKIASWPLLDLFLEQPYVTKLSNKIIEPIISELIKEEPSESDLRESINALQIDMGSFSNKCMEANIADNESYPKTCRRAGTLASQLIIKKPQNDGLFSRVWQKSEQWFREEKMLLLRFSVANKSENKLDQKICDLIKVTSTLLPESDEIPSLQCSVAEGSIAAIIDDDEGRKFQLDNHTEIQIANEQRVFITKKISGDFSRRLLQLILCGAGENTNFNNHVVLNSENFNIGLLDIGEYEFSMSTDGRQQLQDLLHKPVVHENNEATDQSSLQNSESQFSGQIKNIELKNKRTGITYFLDMAYNYVDEYIVFENTGIIRNEQNEETSIDLDASYRIETHITQPFNIENLDACFTLSRDDCEVKPSQLEFQKERNRKKSEIKKLINAKEGLLDLCLNYLANNQCQIQGIINQIEDISIKSKVENLSKIAQDRLKISMNTDQALLELVNELLITRLTQEKIFDEEKEKLIWDENNFITTIEIINILSILKSRANKIKGKNAILYLGPTGAGKSTAVCASLGADLVQKKRGTLKVFALKTDLDTDQTIRTPSIGHSFVESETAFVEIFDMPPQDTKSGYALCDCPGFYDSRRGEFSLYSEYSLHQTIMKAEKVQAVVLVIPMSDLLTNRCTALPEYLSKLEALFPEVMEEDNKQLFILISKSDLFADQVDLREHFTSVLSQAQRNNNSNKKFWDKLVTMKVQEIRARGKEEYRILKVPAWDETLQDDLNKSFSSFNDQQLTYEGQLKGLSKTLFAGTIMAAARSWMSIFIEYLERIPESEKSINDSIARLEKTQRYLEAEIASQTLQKSTLETYIEEINIKCLNFKNCINSCDQVLIERSKKEFIEFITSRQLLENQELNTKIRILDNSSEYLSNIIKNKKATVRNLIKIIRSQEESIRVYEKQIKDLSVGITYKALEEYHGNENDSTTATNGVTKRTVLLPSHYWVMQDSLTSKILFDKIGFNASYRVKFTGRGCRFKKTGLVHVNNGEKSIEYEVLMDWEKVDANESPWYKFEHVLLNRDKNQSAIESRNNDLRLHKQLLNKKLNKLNKKNNLYKEIIVLNTFKFPVYLEDFKQENPEIFNNVHPAILLRTKLIEDAYGVGEHVKLKMLNALEIELKERIKKYEQEAKIIVPPNMPESNKDLIKVLDNEIMELNNQRKDLERSLEKKFLDDRQYQINEYKKLLKIKLNEIEIAKRNIAIFIGTQKQLIHSILEFVDEILESNISENQDIKSLQEFKNYFEINKEKLEERLSHDLEQSDQSSKKEANDAAVI